MFTSLYFAHSCTKHRPQLLPSGSEAMPHENHLYEHMYMTNLKSRYRLQGVDFIHHSKV